MDTQHGRPDSELPPELVQRRLRLREAQAALLAGHADEAERRLADADRCADRARARLTAREAFI